MSDRQLPAVTKELIAARKRIENPENWTTETYCDFQGRRCAEGAIFDFYRDASNHLGMRRTKERGEAYCVLAAAAKELYGENIVRANDHLGHAAVMQLYDYAIRKSLSTTGE